MYLIDANTIIHLVSGRYPRLARKFETVPRGEIQISTIVFAELALGAEDGLAPAVEMLELLITQMPLVPFDESAARLCKTPVQARPVRSAARRACAEP